MPLKTPFSGGNWIAAPLNVDITASGFGLFAPAYRKDHLGIVYLRGTASSSSGSVSTILSLPSGFRPTASCRFIIFAVDSGNAISTGFLEMRSNGNLAYLGGGSLAFSLDQIFFATY